MQVHAVALHGDQPRSHVRRAYADLNRLAARVGRLIELDLKLGIAIQRFRQIRLARHAVAELVHLRARRVPQHQHKISRLVRGQREVAAARLYADLPAVAHNLFPPRNIFVRLVVLLGQHGNVFALHPLQRQRVRRHRIQPLIDRQPVRLPRAAALDEGEVSIRLDPHQVRRAGHDGAVLRRHVAPAFRLERAGQQVQPVRPSREAAQVGPERGDAFVVRDSRREALVKWLIERLAHLEAMLRIPRKHGQHRSQAHFRFHATPRCRLPEKMGHHGARLHVVRSQPSLRPLVAQFQSYLHSIRLELLHLE